MTKDFFTAGNGRKMMKIEFDQFSVEFCKSLKDTNYLNQDWIKYTDKKSGISAHSPGFDIDWDETGENGYKMEFKFKDRAGSEMIFIHYAPSDLKGMFEFIARGFKIPLQCFAYETPPAF